MRIAVASGKGGTGKTTIAANLAALLATIEHGVTYADCDVEEPNGHLFFAPWIDAREAVTLPVPVIDEDLCTGCGDCGSFCQYKAIVTILGRVMTFDELCHGCGGCSLLCAEGAIREAPREIGVVETGATVLAESGAVVEFVQGRLKVKELLATPVIREVKGRLPARGISILDAPPGTSCPMVEAVRGSDLVLLVTEPTPFGLHDLKIAAETVSMLGMKAAVIVNRSDIGDDGVKEYCGGANLEIVAEIPHSREIAELYSRGKLLIGRVGSFTERIRGMVPRVIELAEATRKRAIVSDAE
jgi:MinD superfamily P-loop ATPase